MEPLRINAHWLMLVGIILAASSFPVGALITNELPPAIMMFMRFLFAAILFSPYVFIKNGFVIPPKKSMFNYAILSIPSVVFFWCMFESLRYTSVVNTGALYTLVPAITAVYAFFINREIATKFRIFGLFIGIVGALWIVFKGDFDSFLGLELNYGDLIFITGCLFTSLSNPLVKKFYRGEPMEVMTFWILLFGAGWLLIASGGSLLEVNWFNVPSEVYGGILYLSLFTTLITFFLRQLCVVRIGATKVSAYGLLAPIFVIIITVSIGIEKFELATLPGILLVIVSMLLIQKEPKSAQLKIT